MQRLEQGLLLVLEMKNLIKHCKSLITGTKEEFVVNSRELAQTARELVAKINTYRDNLPEDPCISFLSDLLGECMRGFEKSIVQTLQTTKVALQNPLSLTSVFSSYNCSELVTKSLENILWLSQLIDSVDTETKHLLTTKQAEYRQLMFSHAQQVASDVHTLLEITLPSNDIDTARKIEHFRESVFMLSSSSGSLLSALKEIQNTETIRDELKGCIEGLILFTKHIAQGNNDSFSALQQVRTEFVVSIKNIVIFIHKSLNTELAPSRIPQKTSPQVEAKNKRAGVRVFAGNSSNGKKTLGRSLDLSGRTSKMDSMVKTLSEAENLYLALQVLEHMKSSPWFAENYEKESDDRKILCIKKLHQSLAAIPSKSRTSRCAKMNAIEDELEISGPQRKVNIKAGTFRGSIIGGIVSDFSEHENNPRGLLRNVAKMETSLDINSMVNISMKTQQQSIPRRVEKLRSKRLTLSSATLIETVCVFQASTELLLRAFQPEIPKRVALDEMLDSGEQCCVVLEKILLLASMQKNENATEPPPKLEQQLLQDAFQSLSDVPRNVIEPDRDTLRAIGRDGAYIVIRYLITAIRETQRCIEVITIQICSITRAFQSTKDTSVAGILQIVAAVNLFLQKFTDYVTMTKTYNFATAEIEMASVSIKDTDHDIPFWDEIKTEKDIVREKIISKISLNCLIGLVTAVGTPDVRLQYIFIRNYPSFITDKLLVKKLRERFNVPGSSTPALINAIKRAVLQFISKWIASEVHHLDREVLQDTFEMLKSVNHPMNKPTEDIILKALVLSTVVVKPSPEYIGWSVTDSFMKLQVEVIARQLTLIDFQIYKSIRGRELVQGAWGNSKFRYRAINVRRLIDRQNQLSFWVTTMIVLGKTIKERAEIWEKWMNVALELEKLNNFNSLMGIIAASNMAVTQRLHHTKNARKKNLVAKFDVLGQLMAPHKSWQAFREELKNCTPPAIPYLGVFLTDLTFIVDGNKDTIDGEINWRKVMMVYRILETVKKFQKIPYNIEVENPAYTWLYQLSGLDDESNYQLSLLREPKKIELKALLALIRSNKLHARCGSTYNNKSLYNFWDNCISGICMQARKKAKLSVSDSLHPVAVNVLDLPIELLEIVLNYLPVSFVARTMRKVCKQFQSLVDGFITTRDSMIQLWNERAGGGYGCTGLLLAQSDMMEVPSYVISKQEEDTNEVYKSFCRALLMPPLKSKTVSLIKGSSWITDGQNQSYMKKFYSLHLKLDGKDLFLTARSDVWTGYSPLEEDDAVEGEECFICTKLHPSLSHSEL